MGVCAWGGVLLTLPYSDSDLQTHLDQSMYILEADHLSSAHPGLTQPIRGGGTGGDLGSETPIHSKDQHGEE